MKYRGKVEFLPRARPGCGKPQIVHALRQVDWGDDRDLSAFLPCADPGCDQSVPGRYLAIPIESTTGVVSFERIIIPDGWSWSYRHG